MGRTRYIYTQGGQPLPEPRVVSDDWSDAPRQPLRVDISYMDGLAATDGTPIDSKRKREEYMRRNNLADTSDFSGKWREAKKARDAFRSGAPDPRTREAVGRALYEQSKRKPRK